MTMTSSNKPQSFGPPPVVTELTVEQDFKMKRLELLLEDAKREDIITIFLALQKQAFVLGNNVSNLVKQWPLPTQSDPSIIVAVMSKFGTLSETKD
jgi:hypothetical protein